MVSVGDIIQMKVGQIWQGDQIIECDNTYYYQVAAETGSATLADQGIDLATDWDSQVGTYIRTLQSNIVLWVNIEMTNLNDPDDFYIYSYPPSTMGGQAGAPSASFLSWSFQLVRTTRQTRHGSKRIVGVIDDAYTGNHAIPAWVALLTALAPKLAIPVIWSVGSVSVGIVPVIVRMPPTGFTPTRVNRVSACQYVKLSTQNTRKS